MNQNNATASGSKKKWVPYLFRGILGTVIAATLTQQMIAPPEKGSNFPMYMGFYFLMNGVLSFKMARSAPEKERGDSVFAAIASIIGGLLIIVTFPFSAYRETGIALEIGRYFYGAIVIVIGLLQLLGTVHVSPERIVKQAHYLFGFLEVILGLVVATIPIDWETNAIAFVWVVLVAIYTFFLAYRLRT